MLGPCDACENEDGLRRRSDEVGSTSRTRWSSDEVSLDRPPRCVGQQGEVHVGTGMVASRGWSMLYCCAACTGE